MYNLRFELLIERVPKLTLDILKADSLANLKTIFPQRKCRGTNSFRGNKRLKIKGFSQTKAYGNKILIKSHSLVNFR